MPVQDHRKLLRQYYEMKSDSVEVLEVPALQFITMEGKSGLNWMGLPEEDGWPIPKIVNQLKRITKENFGYPFKLMPPEYIWHEKLEEGQWSFTRVMQIPEIITFDMYEQARAYVCKKYKNIQTVPETNLVQMEQGMCAQMLHHGYHKDSYKTFDEIKEYVNHNGFKIRGDRREILVNWCSPNPDRWTTIVRVPIERE